MSARRSLGIQEGIGAAGFGVRFHIDTADFITAVDPPKDVESDTTSREPPNKQMRVKGLMKALPALLRRR